MIIFLALYTYLAACPLLDLGLHALVSEFIICGDTSCAQVSQFLLELTDVIPIVRMKRLTMVMVSRA